MLIALDYDGTYTADPDLWRAFIRNAQARGHQVFVVTMRHGPQHDQPEHHDVERQLAGLADRIIYTGRRAKRPHVEFLGHRVQVWIDDKPHWVDQDSL